MTKTFFALVLAIAIALTLSGCFGQSLSEKAGEKMVEKAIESGTGGQVNVDANDGNVTIKSEDGQTEISSGGEAKLPEGFPKELVLADDAKIVVSTSMNEGYSVAFTTENEQADMFEKYKSEMQSQGWKKALEMDAGNAKMLNFAKDKQTVSVTVGDNSDQEQGGKTMVNIVLVNENSASE